MLGDVNITFCYITLFVHRQSICSHQTEIKLHSKISSKSVSNIEIWSITHAIYRLIDQWAYTIQIQTTLEPHPNIHSSTLKAVHISKQPKPKSLTDKTLVRTLAKSVNEKGTTWTLHWRAKSGAFPAPHVTPVMLSCISSSRKQSYKATDLERDH